MKEEAVTAKKSPFAVELVQGESYYWCACGRSKNQPFCDGSQQGTGLGPVAFTVEKTGTAYLCGCKRSANRPFCDGSHSKL